MKEREARRLAAEQKKKFILDNLAKQGQDNKTDLEKQLDSKPSVLAIIAEELLEGVPEEMLEEEKVQQSYNVSEDQERTSVKGFGSPKHRRIDSDSDKDYYASNFRNPTV